MFIVQGEGRGHITQAIRMKEILEDEGHIIEKVFLGINPQRKYPDYVRDEFNTELIFFKSPNFLRKKNRRGIKLLSSLAYNLLRSPLYIKSITRIRKEINTLDPDCVINFYDLIGGISFRYSKRRPSFLTLSHHFLFEHPNFPLPGGFPFQNRLLRIHNQIAAPRGTTRIALSFYDIKAFNNTKVMPPLVRKDLIDKKPSQKGRVLVYLLNEGLLTDLLEIFRKNSQTAFILFSDSDVFDPILPENAVRKRLNYKEFGEELRDCKSIICSSGFETICEAAFLGKPVFLIPSEGHYEQHGNLRDAVKAGLAREYQEFESMPSYERNMDFRNWCLKAPRIAEELFSVL